MTIAVSATVHPSGTLARMLAFMFVTLNVIVAYVTYSEGLGWLLVLALTTVSGLISVLLALKFYRGRQPRQIDISDSGGIILRSPNSGASNADSVSVKLLGESTLWPFLLLLHLRSDDGRVHVLCILPDCVSADIFRRLRVAMLWIAMHASTKKLSDTDVSSGNF